MPFITGRFVMRAAGTVTDRGLTAARSLWFEIVASCIVLGFLVFIGWGMSEISAPASTITQATIHLEPGYLPEYALRTTLRMLIAVVVSLLFTLIYATLAAKSRKAGQILIPLLDILQSVPVLGYISFTVTGFMALFPGSALGLECASIFAIFTSQAWNMTFSFYQSLRTVPNDVEEAAFVFRLSGWQKFWKLEWPYAIPGLVWNTMMSMSGGWFFVVASEAITVGNQQLVLPGIGSYISRAINEKDMHAIGWAIGTMAVVILLYDQFLFRPLVAWSEKFSYDSIARQNLPSSWVMTLFSKSRWMQSAFRPVRRALRAITHLRLFAPKATMQASSETARYPFWFDLVWYGALALIALTGLRYIVAFFQTSLEWSDVLHVALLAGITLLRVLLLIFVASLIWVPLGVLIGLNPRLTQLVQPAAQFLAAFPANLLFPIAVVCISRYHLNPDIWLSPLMILGTQWYILFNVIAGAATFPNDLLEASRNFNVKGWLWWRRVILPGIFPYYLTGAITASGGSWNASIVAEAVSWGDKSYMAHGLGAYIAEKTAAGDFVHIALGVGMMALVVVFFNKFFWRRLYDYATRKLRWD